MSVIGHISRRCDEGLRGRGKIIWSACPLCGVERWVPLDRQSQSCRNCSAKERNRELQNWRTSGEHRPDCRCSSCSPVNQWADRNPAWKGGRKITGDGYIVVMLSRDDEFVTMADKRGRTVLEHRLVMARHIGRPLSKDESVHHKNGNRSDNRIQNLELWVGNHGKGIRVEDILNEYAERFGYIKQ